MQVLLLLNTNFFFPKNTVFTHYIQFISYIISFYSSIHSLSISIPISTSITITTLHSNIFFFNNWSQIFKTYQSLIISHIQSIKQQSKVLIYYFLTSLLKSGQSITPNQDKQSNSSNSFGTQGAVRPVIKTYALIHTNLVFYPKVLFESN